LTIRTNASSVLAAAQDSFGDCEREFDTPPLDMRVLVSDTGETGVPCQPVYRGWGEVIAVVADRNNFATCHVEGNSIQICVDRRVVDDRMWFRASLLEGTVLCTLCARYLVAVHAACVSKRGHGVLLHAVSGTGKSCLSYECARRGWTYVSDDATYLVREHRSRTVLGRPQVIKLLESAISLFPELSGMPTFIDPRGEPAIFVRPAQSSAFRTATTVSADALIFLRRERGRAGMLIVDPAEAWERVVSELPVLTASSYEQQKASVRRLTNGKVVEMRYWTLDEGVALLEDLVGALE
jgi:hypothetical protein